MKIKREHKTGALAVAIILTLCILVGCQDSEKEPQTETQKSTHSVKKETELSHLITTEGNAYIAERARLLATDNFTETRLNEKLSQLTSPDEILCARILEARVNKPALAEKVDAIIQKGKQQGTRVAEDDVSPIYLQSAFVRLEENPVLFVLEHILYVQIDPRIKASLLQAVAVFKDDDLRAPLQRMLRETQDPILRMGVIDAIQRAEFTDLLPDVVSLYEKTDDKNERKRILRATRTIGTSDMNSSLKHLEKLEHDTELKQQIQETYNSLQKKQ